MSGPLLLIRDADGSERTVELYDGVMRIGRAAGNEIVLGDASKGVSRAHAELHIEDGRCTIVDLHSQNGTWVNALRVQRAEVRPDAEIAIGVYRLRIQVGPTASTAVPRVVRPQSATVIAVRAPTGISDPPEELPPAPPPPPAPLPVEERPHISDLPLLASSAPQAAASTAAAKPQRSKLPFIYGGVGAVAMIAIAVALFSLPSKQLGAPTPAQKAATPAPSAAPAAPAAPAPATSAPTPSASTPSTPANAAPATPAPPPPAPPPAPASSARDSGRPASRSAARPTPAPAAPPPAATRTATVTPPSTPPTRPAPSTPSNAPTTRPSPAATSAPATTGRGSGRGTDQVRADANNLPVPRKPGESLQDWQARASALQARYAFAKVALDRGDFSAANGGFSALLLEEPGFLDAPQLLTKAREGLRQQAADAIEAGNKLDAAGDWVNALKRYDQAREIDKSVPGLEEAFKRVRDKMRGAGLNAMRRARQFDAVGRFADALAEYEKAAAWLSPDDPNQQIARGRADQLKARLK